MVVGCVVNGVMPAPGGQPASGNGMTVVVVGAGGHARVIAATVRARGDHVGGFLDPRASLGAQVAGATVLGGDEWLASAAALTCRASGWGLANGVGANPLTAPRRDLFHRVLSPWPALPALIHPTAVIAEGAVIGRASQVLARAVVQVDVQVDENAVVNTGAVVEHDCRIGASAFIGPGAVVCGGVHIGAGAFIGASSTTLPGVRIGHDAVIGAGAVVNRDVPPHCTVVGVPARADRTARHRADRQAGA